MSLSSLQSTSDLYLEFKSVLASIQNAVGGAQFVLTNISTLQANPNYAGNVSAAEATKLANCVTYFTNLINNAP